LDASKIEAKKDRREGGKSVVSRLFRANSKPETGSEKGGLLGRFTTQKSAVTADRQRSKERAESNNNEVERETSTSLLIIESPLL